MARLAVVEDDPQVAQVTSRLAEARPHLIPRLNALIELGLRTAAERDPETLLTRACHAGLKIVGARCAAVAVDRPGGGPLFRHVCGMGSVLAQQLMQPEARWGWCHEIPNTSTISRGSESGGDARPAGLPALQPPARSWLRLSIPLSDARHGWLLLLDKLEGDEFTDEDAGLAELLLLRMGRTYEQLTALRTLQHRVAQLERETAERAQVEAALRQSQEEVRRLNADLEHRVNERTAALQRANQELEAFSYSVSHDLRAPLRAINGFSELLLADHASLLPESGQQFLRRILESASRMGALIDDLLGLARVTRSEIVPVDVDLSAMVETILTELHQAEPQRQVETAVEAGCLVRGDRNLLRMALDNLLRNAWKFTGRTEAARIEFGCTTRDDQRVFFVRDNGAGFEMKYVHRLFGAFQRLHPERDFPGTGVGLAIVQRVVHRHGGNVWAEGQPGAGATFYFSLPAGGVGASH